MADKDGIIVIKKVKGKGGHGHHGGAWKVAYADFVTAMMCFFLVMWLMGADEETKQAIEHYFNHPNTPYKQGADPHSTTVRPRGEKEGSGDSVVVGGQYFWPEDLIEMPRPERNLMKDNITLSRLIEDILDGKVYGMDVTEERIKFSLPEKILFAAGSAELTAEATKNLALLGQILKGFKGYITIEGHTDNGPLKAGGKFATNWELSLGRAVSVMNYFVKNVGMSESKLFPVGSGPRRSLASNDDPKGREQNRRVEFTLSYDAPPL
jgi:chemotaxis protein MotB